MKAKTIIIIAIIYLLLLSLYSCSPVRMLNPNDGQVFDRNGNMVKIKFSHINGKDYAYDYFYLPDSAFKVGTKVMITTVPDIPYNPNVQK